MKLLKEQGLFTKRFIINLVFSISLGAFGVIFSILIPLKFKQLIDGISSTQTVNTTVIIQILIFVLIEILLQIFSTYALQKLGITVVYTLRDRVFSQIIYLKRNKLNDMTSGNLTSILTNDTSALYHLISSTMPALIISVLSIIFMSISLFYLSLKLSLILLIVIPVIMMIYFPLGKLLTKFSIETQNKLGVFTDFGSFISKENAFIKVNLTHELERKKGIDIIDSLRSISKKQAKIFAIITPIVSMLLIFSILSVIAYGLYLVNVDSLSLGSLVAYLTLFFQIINPISNLGKSFSEIKGIAGATFRIRNLLNIRDKEQLDFGKNELKINSLKFTDVSFSYESTEIKAAKTEVLKNINFSALSGSLTAFVGPSGSGKTTIFSLIERMYTNYDGKILLNNLSLEDIPLSNSREKMGYVMQNYPVFQGTVKDNLLYGLGSEISEEKILEISAVTNFKTVIDDLPQGLDTVLLENGNSLSEGQKQRLAITRCLLADFDLLLLDEVTSSLDAFSEKIIQETIDFYVKEKQKVVLVNAHRLSTIRKADQIIFLDKGIITGIGTHEDLIKTHGLYKEFIEMQF